MESDTIVEGLKHRMRAQYFVVRYVEIFLCSRVKKAFKLSSQASFGVAKWFISFKLLSSEISILCRNF